MLELPECIVFAKEMNESIVGHKVVSVIVNQSPHKFAFFSRDAMEYPDILKGLEVKECVAYGGAVLIDFGYYQLAFLDGAYPRYTKKGEKAPKSHQFYMEFDDGSVITVRIQMYGCIFLVDPLNPGNEFFQAALSKPSPLSKEFNFEYFQSICAECKENASVKALLATEQRIPGLGNGVLQDILYVAHLNPKRKLSTLTKEEYVNLYDAIGRTLGEMTELGGRDTEKDFYGNNGKYITYLSKNTYLTPCPRCGHEIGKASYMGGTVYFCEKCQPI